MADHFKAEKAESSDELNQAASASTQPGPVDVSEPVVGPIPAADVLPFAGAMAPHHRAGQGGAPSALPDDQTAASVTSRPAAPPAGDSPPRTPEVPPRRGVSAFELLLELCAPPPPKVGAFAHGGSLIDVRSGHADPATLMDKLRVACSIDELRDAGVVVIDGLERPQVHPDLVGPSQLWLAMRDSSGTAFEVVGNSGGIRTGQPVAESIHWDMTFRQAALLTGLVVVVFSLADMVLLRRLGVAAVLATDLARVPIDPAERVAVATDRRFAAKPKDEFPDNKIANVLLLAYSIADNDPAEPPGLPAVQDHFWVHPQSLGYANAEVWVWRPSPNDQSTLQWLLSQGDTDGLRRFLEKASDGVQPLSESLRPATSPPPAPPPPPTLAELMQRHLKESEEYKRLSDTERQIQMRLFEKMIKPLIQQAEAELDHDPVGGNLRLALASSFQAFHFAARQQTSEGFQDAATKTTELAKHIQQIRTVLQLITAAAGPTPATLVPPRIRAVTLDVPPSYVRLMPQ